MQFPESLPLSERAPWVGAIGTDPRMAGTLRLVESVASGLANGPERATEPTLASGLAGQCLLYGYLVVAGRPGWDAILEDSIAAAAGLVEQAGATTFRGLSLYGGVVGVAWVIEHLRRIGAVRVDEDPNADVDLAVEEALRRSSWSEPFDLIFGLVGMAIYLLERLPSDRAADGLNRIVEHLDALSDVDDERARWRSPLLPPGSPNADIYASGLYDLGMAHGCAGIIAVLARMAAAGIAPGRCEALLRRAVRYLLEQRLPPGNPSMFPSFVVQDRTPQPSRLAWCYGDPGIAVAVLMAGEVLGDTELRREALEIGRHAAVRSEATGVLDATVCHGSAGLGLLFRRLHGLAADDVFDEAAIRWTVDTLAGDRGSADAPEFWVWNALESRYERRQGFLDGEAGIALFLLHACSGVAPDWDRVLLTSGL
jgi:lantibiotic modifying enzyme